MQIFNCTVVEIAHTYVLNVVCIFTFVHVNVLLLITVEIPAYTNFSALKLFMFTKKSTESFYLFGGTCRIR